MIALELPPLPYAATMQAGLAFLAGFLELVGLIALFGLFIGTSPPTSPSSAWRS